MCSETSLLHAHEVAVAEVDCLEWVEGRFARAMGGRSSPCSSAAMSPARILLVQLVLHPDLPGGAGRGGD